MSDSGTATQESQHSSIPRNAEQLPPPRPMRTPSPMGIPRGAPPLPPGQQDGYPSIYTRVLQEPVVTASVPLLHMIQRTNEFLATSAPEFKLVRQHICQELEFHLIQTGNFEGFEFLDQGAQDTSRRRYKIAPRLMIRNHP